MEEVAEYCLLDNLKLAVKAAYDGYLNELEVVAALLIVRDMLVAAAADNYLLMDIRKADEEL
jgi:hypothetical protein